MIKKLLYYFFICTCIALASCQQGRVGKKNKIPTLAETYDKNDYNAFGGSVTYKVVKDAFEYEELGKSNSTFSKFWMENSYTKSIYISFSKMQFLNSDDADFMLQFANNGNDLFLVSREFDTTLLNAAGVKEIDGGDAYNPYYNFKSAIDMDDNKVDLSSKYYTDTLMKEYFYFPFYRHFKINKNSTAKVLSRNQNGEPNGIVFFYGKGRIFLHCDPRAFSNYYLLKEENTKFLTSLLGYTMKRPYSVYWDTYYCRLNSPPNTNTGLSYLLSKPPLAWAFWLAMGLLLLYILFGGKRRQRIVPDKKANVNHTVNFAETMGLLYLQNKSNRNIADKMILYFNDFIRNNYYINTNQINDEFIESISRKSGVPHVQVEKLYDAIKYAQNNFDIDDYRLLSLNQHIQNFYKKIQ